MKKLLAILAGIIIIAIIVFMLFGGFGLGTGSGSGDGEEGTSTSQTVDENEEPDVEVEEPVTPGETKEDSESGAVVEVSVVKGDYFYENKRIDLDEFIEIICAIDGQVVVEVTDDNAALKPYNKLLDRLEDLEITYTECVAN